MKKPQELRKCWKAKGEEQGGHVLDAKGRPFSDSISHHILLPLLLNELVQALVERVFSHRLESPAINKIEGLKWRSGDQRGSRPP
jgi:hypothetical protein